jgi:hypothetical protein
MGYYMMQGESEVIIRSKDFDAALAAIKKLAGKGKTRDTGGSHYSWVHDDEYLSARTLEEALVVWGWMPEFDGQGNIGDITDLMFEREKIGDEDVLFNAIAPYVKRGSYICMTGEDGEQWRWYFDGKRCVQQTGRVVYDSR